jgi:p-hydroxybenzoate 3-monooxygenase
MSIAQRTQVGIVGAGPAGLMLGRLLSLQGIDSVILEARSQSHVIDRVRAGVLEQATVDLMHQVGLGQRLDLVGLRHEGLYLAFNGRRHRVDLSAATNGRAIMVYGQHEVVRDLIDARVASGLPLHFEAPAVSISDITGRHPRVDYDDDSGRRVLNCDFIAGCDGFHGIARGAIPSSALQIYERTYPFAWLGVLANAPPSSHELVYSLHERGFALFSMRSPTVSRLYLQCDPHTDLAEWPDDRIWSELTERLATDDGWRPTEGEITQKSVTAMRSFVTEPMHHGRLYLAGDAAHIVPPTGAKGLNLAMADVHRLSQAIVEFYQSGRTDLLNTYSARGVRRAWRAQAFSWRMTSLLHRTDNDFDYRRQLAELEDLVSSPAAIASFAENYVGSDFSSETTFSA